MRLEDFRKQYPQYSDISDEDLAKGLHRRFYSDIPFEDFSQRVGLITAESGFFPALKAGASGVQEAGYALAGRTGLMDEAAAQKAIEEEQAYQQRVFKPTEEGFLEAPVTKTLELLGGSLPYMGVPLAAAGATALAPLTGTAATVAGLGAAGVASVGQFTGTNLLRQMEPTDEAPQGKSIGETDLGNAALAAVPQAALDVLSLRMMPFIRGVFGQVGKDLGEEEARRIASKNLKDVAADYALATGKTMTVEGLTEAAQQSLERLQAGLTMTDEAARDEYLESFIGGAVLGGVLAPPGRYLERRAAQKEVPPETKPEPTATQPIAPTPITDEDELTPEEEADLQARIAAAPPAAGLPVAATPTQPLAPSAAVQQVTATPEAVALPGTQQLTPQAAPELEVLTAQLARIQQARMDPTLSPDDPAFLEFDQQEAAIQARIQQLTASPAAVTQPPVQPLAPPVAPVIEPEVTPEIQVPFDETLTPPGPTLEDQVRAQKAEERRERQAAQEAKKGEFVLQNRDRSSTGSIQQMQNIANAPDYSRAGFSRTPDGAPIIAFGDYAPEQLGREDVVTTARGRKIPVQYAVVEADEVITSNDIQGRADNRYGDKSVPGPRAIAGNGRITGLRESFERGTATPYVEEMAADSTLHGISPDVIAGMKKPVLVRVMPQEGLTRDIGDELNISSMLELSPVEQAKNDLNRVDFEGLQFNEDGEITNESLSQFISAQPVEERTKLIDRGLPTKQARQRLENAIFARAYADDDLIAMFAQTEDVEARLVINALAQVAPQMAQLEGAGDLDIRDIVTDAAKIIVSGKRRGLKLKEISAQVDMTVDPDTKIIVDMFAQNPRSNKAAIESLRNAAELAYNESIRPEEGLFGVEPRRERRDIMEQMRRGYEPTRTEDVAAAERPRPAPSDVERKAEPSAAGVPPADQDFALTGQTPEELAELQRKELSGEAEAERDRIEAEEAARAAAEAERKIADQKRETFQLAPPPSAPAVQAAGPVGDLFGTTGIREQPTRAPRRIGAEPSPIEAAIEESISKEVMGTPQEALDNLLQFLRIGSPTTNVTYDPNEKTILTENVYSGDTRIKRIEFDAITSLANKVDGRDGATYSILIKDTPTESVVFKFQPRGIKPLDRAVDIRYSLSEAKKDVNVPPIEEAIAKRMKELGVDDFEERSKAVQEFYGVSKPVADAYVRAKRKNAEEVAKWSYGLSTEAKFAESLKEVNKLLKRMEGVSKRKEPKAKAKKEERPKGDVQTRTVYRTGPSFMDDLGPNVTAADVVRYEQEELGNQDLRVVTDADLSKIPTSKLEWVTFDRTDAEQYLPEDVDPEDTTEITSRKETFRVLAQDSDGGYLIERVSAAEVKPTSKEDEVAAQRATLERLLPKEAGEWRLEKITAYAGNWRVSYVTSDGRASNHMPIDAEQLVGTTDREIEATLIERARRNGLRGVAEAISAKKEKPKAEQFVRGTEEQLKEIKEFAKRYGGSEVAYYDPDKDIGMVLAFGKFDGDPKYIPYIKGVFGRTAFDISVAKFSDVLPYKAELLEIKERLEKAAEKKHQENPFIKFERGIALSDGMDPKIEGIIRGWKDMLGLGGINIYFSTTEDAKKNINNFTGPHRRIGSATIDANERGSMRRMEGGASYYVVFDKSTSTTKMLEVIAHEMGHVHEKVAFDQAPQEVKDKLKAAYEKWLEGRKDKTSREAIQMLRAKTTAKTTDIGQTIETAEQLDKLDPYWSKFSEWYADQVSRWAVTDEKPVGVVEKFFARLGAALRRFYQNLKGQGYLPDETFVQYLKQVKPTIVETIPGPIKDPVNQDMSSKMQTDLFGSPQEAKDIGEAMEVKGKKKLPAGRSPELAAAAQAVQAGTMTAEEFNKLVDIYKPIPLYEEPLKPATSQQVFDALDVKKREQINPEIPNGTKVGLRLDIPAFNRKGVFVVSIHRARNVVKNPLQKAFAIVNPGDKVSGLTVRTEVPNMSSIGASLENYEVLYGIRVVPTTAFDKEYLDSLRKRGIDKRTSDLSDQIKQSKEINPLIVAIDNQGAYIIEGGHRFDALMTQGRKSVPAKVVIDNDNPPTRTASAPGKIIGYGSVAKAKNVTFGVGNQLKALEIAAGSAKDALQTIEGDYVNVTPEQAFAEAQRAIKDPSYVQIGIDPTRHAYFYDRRTTLPVVSAEEVIQIGNMILAKKPVFGSKQDFLYNIEGGPIAGDTQPDDMSFLDRLFAEDKVKRKEERNETLAYYKSIRRKEATLLKKVREYGSTIELQRQLNNLNEIGRELKEDLDLDKQPVYSAENFLRQARAALEGVAPYKEQAISPEVFAVIQSVYMDDPKILEGLRLSIKPEFSKEDQELRRAFGMKRQTAGTFMPMQRLINLYTGTRGVTNASTIRHELTHTLEQMMTEKQRQALVNSYLDAIKKAMRKHKDAKSQEFFDLVLKFLNNPTDMAVAKMNDAMPSYDFYQYTSPSEYWAVNAEKLMAQRLGTSWDRFKKAIRKVFEKMKSIFGFDNRFMVHDVFDNIMSGSKKRMDKTMLVDYIGTSGESFAFLANVEEDAELVRRYNRAPTSQTDSAPLRRIMIGAAENSKDLFKSMVESPSEAINFMFNSVNRGVMFLRNKFIWFGSGINEADRIRYNGAVKTAEDLATASVALDNMIRGGNIATQVVMQGGVEFNKKTQMYGAAQKDKSMANVYRAEAKLKEKLGDQLGTDIEQGYLQAKRSRSIIDEVETRTKIVESLNEQIDEMVAASKALDADPKATQKQKDDVNRELRRLFKEYRVAADELKTIKRIREDKVTMSEQEIADFIQREEAHPELKEILDNFNAVNQNLLRFWRDVGLLSEARYNRLSSIKDYVPWYRVMDDDADIHDPVQATTRSATNIGKEKLFKAGKPSVVTDFTVEENQKVFKVQPGTVNAVKLNGIRLKPDQYDVQPNGEITLKVEAKPGQLLVVETQREIENMIDNMTRNVMRMTMNGLRQYAANRIVSEYATREAGKIKRFASADRNKGRFDYVENGRRTIVEIQDPLIAEAILGMETVGMKMWEPLAAAANFTRRTITLSPVFQLKQVFKDAPTAALVTGVRNPAALMGGVMRDFIGAVRNNDPVAEILRSQGIGGFYSPARTPEADVKRQIGIINNNTYDYVMKALDHFGDSSDMAQRIAIYKRVMAETGDETLALYQAANVINFLRHGSGQVAQALVKTVPFLNAYAQSIDVLYDALRGGGLRGKDRAAALRQLAYTGSLLAGTTLIYAMLVGDDDDYMKMDDQSKIRSYMIPGTDVVLPMNTSAAFFFKAIPELLYNKVVNEGTENEVDAKRLRTAMKEAAVDLLLGPTPVPSAVKPVIEIGLDYNFFTSRPITPRGMQSLDAYQQYDMRTSEAAKILSSLTGTDEKRVLNPMEADHLVRSIFGTAGAMVAWSSNLVGEAAEFRPEMGLKEMPVTGAFLRPEVPRGREDLFYKLKDDTDRKYRTFLKLTERDNQAEAQAYINRHPNLIAYYEYTSEMDAQLKEINSAIRFIGETRDPSYTPEIKRREIQEFLNLKQDILEGIEQFRKEAYSQ